MGGRRKRGFVRVAAALGVLSLAPACSKRALDDPASGGATPGLDGATPGLDGATPGLDGATPIHVTPGIRDGGSDAAETHAALDGAGETDTGGRDGSADASADGSADASPDGPLGPPVCVPGEFVLEIAGTIGPRSFRTDGSSSASSSTGFPVLQPSWSTVRATSPDEALLAWGKGGADGGMERGGGGLIVLPDEPPPGATHYCAAKVEAELTSDSTPEVAAAAIVLSELSVLGRCPGVPVAGAVEYCTSGDAEGDPGAGACARGFGIFGTVEGVDIDFGDQGGISSTGEDATDIRLEAMITGNDEAVAILGSRADGLVAGWLRLPNNDAPGAGTVYCLQAGRPTKAADGAYVVTFASIGRLGLCPGVPIDGRVDLCR